MIANGDIRLVVNINDLRKKNATRALGCVFNH